jgi:Holliday junction resolvase RusA-like endonuclease
MSQFKEYVINFNPISWKRAGLNKKTFYDTQKHEKLATGLHLKQQHGDLPQFKGPLRVEITFRLPFPKALRDRRKDLWCDTRPDMDNLTAFLFDTINDVGTIWSDDCQVASQSVDKVYGRTPSTCIIIKELL